MFTRTFSALVLMLLAGCSRGNADAAAVAANAPSIDCALHGASDFRASCTVEQVNGETGAELIVRHPDGGFRRFSVLPGRGLATADGSEAGHFVQLDGRYTVIVGTDRYHIPSQLVRRAGG